MNDPGIVREMSLFEAWWTRAKSALKRFRRKLPYLVWYGDEIDCGVTFSQFRLDPESADHDGKFVHDLNFVLNGERFQVTVAPNERGKTQIA